MEPSVSFPNTQGPQAVDNFPPPLTSLIESLKKEGIYLGQEEFEVKSAKHFEQKAIQAVNEAIRQASALYRETLDVAHGARILEKIQIAAAEAERAAYIIHSARAKKCSELAQRIALQSREFFHELKTQKTALKQRIA